MEFTLIVKVPCISIAILILSFFRPTSCKRTDPEYQLDCHTKCLMLKSKRVSTVCVLANIIFYVIFLFLQFSSC